jgi:hypothetical protein
MEQQKLEQGTSRLVMAVMWSAINHAVSFQMKAEDSIYRQPASYCIGIVPQKGDGEVADEARRCERN